MGIAKRAATAAAIGALTASAWVGLANPASAELLNGSYTRTVTATGPGLQKVGSTASWVFSPCEPDCLHLHQSSNPEWDRDLHLEGNAYTGVFNENRSISIDKNSLVVTENFKAPDGHPYTTISQLTKD